VTTFTINQTKALNLLEQNIGDTVTIEEIAQEVYGPNMNTWPKNWKTCIKLTMRSLRVRCLDSGGPEIKRVSPLGRGNVALYSMSRKHLIRKSLPPTDGENSEKI